MSRPAPEPARRSLLGGVTLRAAGLALALCALVVILAVPLRSYLSQRAQIADLRAQERLDRAAVAGLQQRRAQWKDPAYVRAQARERLHFVQPGETAYVVVGTPTPAPAATPAAAAHPAAAPGSPWYAQVWASVVAAGAPTSAATGPRPGAAASRPTTSRPAPHPSARARAGAGR